MNVFFLFLLVAARGLFSLSFTPLRISNMQKCRNQHIRVPISNKMSTVMTLSDSSEINRYHLHWYVIGETKHMRKNKLNKVTIWNHDYVVWQTNNTYYAIDDSCSHRGASLSGGHLYNGNVICPYHGYEFDCNGTLTVVPGLNFTNTPCQNIDNYNVVEKNGWIYMNTVSNRLLEKNGIVISNYSDGIFVEEEAKRPDLFSTIFLNVPFKSYARLVSENSLDVMHIGFVHTFGNRAKPSPTKEVPPYLVLDYPYHYKTVYEYQSGEQSIAKRIFEFNDITIENEFILPHTTVARVKFGEFTSTVVTFALPINQTHSRLFVKTYRNFWRKNSLKDSFLCELYNYLGNYVTTDMMRATVLQDKGVVENILPNYMDGKFNMKFDKLQNVYKTLYKKLVHNFTRNNDF